MDSKRSSKKFAVLDLDETLIEGSLGYRVARVLLDPRKGLIPKKYYLHLLRHLHLPILSKVRRSYRIYRYVLRRSYQLYLKLLNDPEINKEKLFSVLSDEVRKIEIPKESTEFIELLKKKGYTTVILTASPQELAEIVGKKVGADRVIGSRPDLVLDREGKERIIRELMREGPVDIIVGNPGNEPFWLARKLAVIVRSPRDLKSWMDRI